MLFNFHNSRIIKTFKFDMFFFVFVFILYVSALCTMRVPGALGGNKRVSGVMKSMRSHVDTGYQKAPQRSSSTKNKSKNIFF